ncbi:Pyridoxine/pyridoxamine 5'-phosphate oxidase [Candidatus Terasakiella magnetica]|uniref:Pyridoxine/pyridoxamine 5'-phosphate oxidase n=1 Tax=Candidatus Terasakiella magnetica TaxID=1867952 RepID=A0A1C3RKC5_9PROT|nr:pyridoxamine 5'-phosphate oxidase [Candidatus Terasakiella magnetica]SCA57696.1 Pyridoxine/pyridoxamine 5'-phosphate oxidase [Candidatus Terasakiella magnetica]
MTQSPNPISLFHEWMEEAEKNEINDPNAMSLATANKDGIPSVRMVLLKGADEKGFVFYTNLKSRKARELMENPNAALCLHWKSLRKQVRVEGAIEPVSDEEADEYFQSRARVSRIGAWASKQSQEMEGRFELEKRVAEYTAKFGVGEIPRPDFWSGFRLKPKVIEFWSDQKFRLHDRIVYEVNDGNWATVRLFP